MTERSDILRSSVPESLEPHRRFPVDGAFFGICAVIGGGYIVLIVAMLLGMTTFTTLDSLRLALARPEIRASIRLTLISCTLSAILSIWVAIPLGYLLTRCRVPARSLWDALIDIPIGLPPLVVGLSLLILFHTPTSGGVLDPLTGGQSLERLIRDLTGQPITHAVPAVLLAQFTVSCAFAVRTMRVTFEQIDPRTERVALTLGCGRCRAFLRVVLPQAGRGILAAFTLAWARALGEFGPILVFAGTTRYRTEVLSTSVFLELSVGNLDGAVAVSLLMIALAIVVLVPVRMLHRKTDRNGSQTP